MRSHLVAVSLLAWMSFAAAVGGQEPQAGSALAETGKRLSNPVSDVWAMFARFELGFADGNVNLGDSKTGAMMIFQPILPVPLYGHGAKRWNLITRPTIPILFSEAVPTGLNSFDRKGGLGDIQLPALLKSTLPELSNDVPALPGPQSWGLGFHLTLADVPGMRTAEQAIGLASSTPIIGSTARRASVGC